MFTYKLFYLYWSWDKIKKQSYFPWKYIIILIILVIMITIIVVVCELQAATVWGEKFGLAGNPN